MSLFLITIGILAAYHRLSSIQYRQYQGSISSAYCRLAGFRNRPTRPVIFVPGIKGSTLDTIDQRMWLSLRQIFPSDRTLSYTAAPGGHPIEATGIFDRLTVIPGLVEYRPYYLIAAQLACSPHAYLFWYDWRDKPQKISEDFERLVDRVRRETGEDPALIAHSMGGLIAHPVVKEHPEKFAKIVYVTVPFNPGIGYLDDLNNGAPVGFNRSLLSADVVFSHPSSFVLLPHAGTLRYKQKELMDARTWRDDRLSVFRGNNAPSIESFQTVLGETMAYHQRLDRVVEIKNSVLFIVGNCHSTVFSILPDGSRVYRAGDGRVSEESSYPKDHIPNQTTVRTCVRHGNQLNDPGIINTIFEFIRS